MDQKKSKRKDNIDTKWAWPNLLSEYTAMYQPWHNQQRPLMIPNDETHWFLKAEGKQSLSTTYGQGFRPRQSVPACATKQKSHTLFSSKKQPSFMNLSTYKDNYYEKSALLRTPLKPQNPDHPGTFHYGAYDKLISVSQDTYRAYDKEEALNARRQLLIIKDPEGAFSPVSAKVYKESDDGNDDRKKMEFFTTQRTDYTAKKPAHVIKPVVPLTQDEYIKRRDECCKSDLMTTFMGDYVMHHKTVERPKSYQPVCEYQPPALPFKNPSTYSKDFRNSGGILRKGEYVAKFKIPDTVFKHTTVYKDEHNGERAHKSKSCYPKLQEKISRVNNKFCGETFYNTTYTTPTPPPDLRSNFKSNSAKKSSNKTFVKNSTAHAHYSGQPGLPSRICVPRTKSRI